MTKETTLNKLLKNSGPYKTAYTTIDCDIPALKVDGLNITKYGVRNVAMPRGKYDLVITNNKEDEIYSKDEVILYSDNEITKYKIRPEY